MHGGFSISEVLVKKKDYIQYLKRRKANDRGKPVEFGLGLTLVPTAWG